MVFSWMNTNAIYDETASFIKRFDSDAIHFRIPVTIVNFQSIFQP